MWQEFKKFISRGNVIDMAVGIIIGSAFTAIVTSLVNDILTPLLGIVLGGIDFASLSITVGEGEHVAVLAYGAFIQAVINFFLIAIALFFLIKSINSLHKKKEEPAAAPTTKECPFCHSTIHIDAVRCPNCTSEIPVEEKEE